MGFGNNSNGNSNNNSNAGDAANNARPQGKEDVFNKVKFSSVKLGETKQGSPTIGLYLKRDQMEKMHALLTELLATPAGTDGCKIGCICISGKDYDSGYAYINPKEPKQDNRNGGNTRQNNNNNSGGYNNGRSNNTQGNNQGGYRKTSGNFGDRSSAKSFLEGKRLNDGEEGGSGN